jgi:hypothetical protein
MDDVKGDPMPDDLDDIDVDFDLMSTRISDLSKAESRPDEFTVPEELEPDAIDWDDFNWVSPLLEVQQWLHFDNEVSVSSDLSTTIRNLFEALTDEDAADNYAIESGQPKISSKGWACIDNRLGQATQHMQEYCTQIEAGVDSSRAYSDWSDSWGEKSGSSTLGRIEATTSSYPISEFVAFAERNHLVLNPPYQRNDVWSVGQSQELVDSILRGIPLPSVILNKISSERIEIVDGKQRITAILRFMGLHPKALKYVNEVCQDCDDTDEMRDLYKSDFPAWKKRMKPHHEITSKVVKKHFLPYPLRRIDDENDELRIKGLGISGKLYYCQIKEVEIEVGSTVENIELLFTRISKYRIPIIEFNNTDLDQIALVFNRYNSQGVKLNAEEIRNAKFHDVDLCAMLLALSEKNCGDKEKIESFTSDQQGTIPMVLNKLGFKDNRFVRTKYACWVASLLAQQPNLKKKTLTTPSPKIHIDSLFHSIEHNSSHPLHERDKAKEFSGVLIDGIHLLWSIHGDMGWPEEYTSKRGTGAWEALPLVSSWLACSIAINSGFSLSGSDAGALTKKIRDIAAQILPPDKQQSKTQWEYFASTTLALLDAFDLTDASANLISKLNYSCLETFEQLSPAVAKP